MSKPNTISVYFSYYYFILLHLHSVSRYDITTESNPKHKLQYIKHDMYYNPVGQGNAAGVQLGRAEV